MLFSRFSFDPELYVLLQTLRRVRHFLWSSSLELQAKFCRIVAKHRCRSWEVHGPAGALAYNLSKIGWAMNRHGIIRTHSAFEFNLLTDDWKTIQDFITQAWMKHIFEAEIDRPGWRHMPEIDLQATRQVFANQPPSHQLIAMYSTSGAYMMAGQTRHFTDSDGLCVFCQTPDSEQHRLLECVHFQHVRASHTEIVTWLEEHNICYTRLPFVPKTQHWENDLWLQHQMPGPSYVQEVLDQIEQFPSDDWQTFYTDGSCLHPNLPSYRTAGFAAVWHPPSTDEQKRDMASHHLQQHTLPPSFQVFATGPCVGRQTISRAELQVIIAIADLELNSDIHTDSQYAIDATHRLGTHM